MPEINFNNLNMSYESFLDEKDWKFKNYWYYYMIHSVKTRIEWSLYICYLDQILEKDEEIE